MSWTRAEYLYSITGVQFLVILSEDSTRLSLAIQGLIDSIHTIEGRRDVNESNHMNRISSTVKAIFSMVSSTQIPPTLWRLSDVD